MTKRRQNGLLGDNENEKLKQGETYEGSESRPADGSHDLAAQASFTEFSRRQIVTVWR